MISKPPRMEARSVRQELLCIVPDNGSGTATLPPIGCGYLSPRQELQITDGLPGSVIELEPRLEPLSVTSAGASNPGALASGRSPNPDAGA